MPFARPTLQQLVSRAAADIQAHLPGADARLRRTALGVIARMHAGGLHGQYGYLDWLARQLIFDTAEAEILERWASIWGISRLAATSAQGSVTFTGANGADIPAGTVLVRSDGAEYETDALATIAAGTATAAVTAIVPGAAGNADAGSELAIETPIPGVDTSAVVAAGGLAQGTDTESDEALRARFLVRIRKPPHGGAERDYVAWAKEVAGVTRAWVFPAELGAGTVTVRFVRDEDTGGIIPDAPEVQAVQDYIDERRPVTAAVTVVAPIAVPLDFTFTLLAPNTQAVQDAIAAELADLIQREAEPGGTILLSHIREAISIAAGEDNFTLTAPAADVMHATGELATLGAITWP